MTSIYPNLSGDIARRGRNMAPAQLAAFEALSTAAFADGTIPAKVKQIISVAIAHVTNAPIASTATRKQLSARELSQGDSLLDRRAAFEHMRDLAAERYAAETGSAWRPRAGSLVNHRHLTAAVIDSRDFIAARRKADTELLLPKGPKIAFSGGADYTDARLIWAVLDKVLAKHPDMVLVHGGTPQGAKKTAACWADHRKVMQIAFRPD